jgi:basic membrane protein A
MKKSLLGAGLLAVATLSLVACGSRDSGSTDSSSEAKTDLKVAVITDTGGVDDKSFNQSAWEGLQAWGKENGLKKGEGYNYFQSASESDYATNLDSAISQGYKLIYGIGFALHNAIADNAKQNSDINYVLIDDVIEGQDNVVSATFADNEASYLAGVAAAKTTKTKHVGFIGGVEGAVITRFQKGFEAGVKSVDPSIKVSVDYAASFADAAKGKTLGAAQYAAGADVIFQCAGGTGAGVFSAAKALNETKDEADKVWVIGVDRDQKEEGAYTSKDGKDSNYVLCSTIKKVGTVVEKLSTEDADGKFEGGKHLTYTLKDGGVDLADGSMSDDAKKAVDEARAGILDGSIVVPES